MIYVCPNCGQSLPKPLQDGIAICNRCSVLFDSSKQSRMLSAAWLARKKPYTKQQIMHKLMLSEDEASTVEDKVVVEGMSHEEFLSFLRSANVPSRCYMK